MLCQEMNDFHFLSQESCMTGAFACFQSGLRTCFAITYFQINVLKKRKNVRILYFVRKSAYYRKPQKEEESYAEDICFGYQCFTV